MIKIELIITDIRKVFQVCEKFYGYDANSIRISRTLEAFFEGELKSYYKAQNKKEIVKADTLSKMQLKGGKQDSKTFSISHEPKNMDK